MTVIFDGKQFAKEKEANLAKEVKRLAILGIKPKLVSILVGDNRASVLYVDLKKKAGERVGVEVEIKTFSENVGFWDIVHEIKNLNKNRSVHGIMIQLPLPRNFSIKERDKIVNEIAKEKDVDGLRNDSVYLTPTVKSVLQVIKEANQYIVRPALGDRPRKQLKVVVVGAKGFEGKKIFKVIKEMGYDVDGIDKSTKNLREKTKAADILISVTGSPGIIGKDHIKESAIIIDVGSPHGDVKLAEIVGKASFISPVPGGIGPLTIFNLLDNLVEATES